MFIPPECELPVFQTANTLVVQWSGPGCVVFSYAQRGKGINAHFSSDKEGLRHLKAAIEDFCGWIFNTYTWCEFIFAMIKKNSVVRLVKKCGFTHLIDHGGYTVYMRPKPWVVH